MSKSFPRYRSTRVLNAGCVHADLEDDAVEHFLRECIHLKIRLLTEPYLADLALVSFRINLHFGEIECNREEGWRLQGGCYGLSNIDVPGRNVPLIGARIIV